MYHNLYTQIDATKKWGITAGIDVGSDKNKYNKKAFWLTYVAIARYVISPKHTLAIRGEYFDDKRGALIETGTKNGMQVAGFSINYDYTIAKNILWRSEAKHYIASDNLFNNGKSDKNLSLLSTLSIKL
jgi:hypothetical protein